jgi:hypothetical protein
MTDLRKLVIYSFLAGMFFDAFISATVRNSLWNGTIFIILTVLELWVALKVYDKVKVKK